MQQVHEHDSVLNNNRFCEIKVLGELVEDDKKCGSNKICILREIKGKELEELLGKVNGNAGVFNTGNDNAGHHNTGNDNTGNRNAGNGNTGNRNAGYGNTGNGNTGDYNQCNRSTGFFNTTEQNIMIFNQDIGMKYDEFIKTNMYKALYSSPFLLTEWIYYTDEEKGNSPIRQCIGGYLKQYTFKEACANWWNKMSNVNKNIIQIIPNFDKTIFEEITGIQL